MYGQLKKATLRYTVAPVPAVPPRAAWCYTPTSVRYVWGRLDGGSGSGVRGGGSEQWQHIGNESRGPSINVNPDGSYQMHTGVSEIYRYTGPWGVIATYYDPIGAEICFPATPGVPAVVGGTFELGGPGWNGGAQSIRNIPLSGYFRVIVPRGVVGVAVGLTTGTKIEYDYASVEFGVAIIRDRAVWVENGVESAEIPLPAEGDYDLRFVRRDGTVLCYLNGALVARSSAVPREKLYSPTTGIAVLYSPTDYVYSPFIGVDSTQGGSGRVPVGMAFAGDRPLSQVVGRVSVATLQAQVRELAGVKGRVPTAQGAFGLNGPYHYGGGRVPRAALTARFASGGPHISVSGGGGNVPRARGSSRVLAGGLCNVGGQVPVPAGLVADRPYAAVRFGQVPAPRGECWDEVAVPGQLVTVVAQRVADFYTLDFPLVVVITDGVAVSTSMELLLVSSLEYMDSFNVRSELGLTGDVLLNILESARVADGMAHIKAAATSYAVNIVTGALAEYEGDGFTHYAQVGGELWGAKIDGLYRLNPGATVSNALLDLGTTDWGTQNTKRVSYAYIGVRTDGEVFLRVTTDGKEQVFRVLGGQDIRRVKLGVGVAARNWKFEIEVVDATFASVDSVEFMVGTTQRRIRARR